ncbi:hypothetical protein [Kitasatospora sp. NPDC050543]|uniref:hypothetical protein n=1 Tax=Kitasatospora sp. NPDC050543 TaxID=3364054 RepID=UPI0037BCF378
MDTEQHTMAGALREAEELLRETLAGPARASRDRIERADEERLLAAVAGLADQLKGLTGVFSDRMTTPGGRTTFHRATQQLGSLASDLRRAGRQAAKGNL